MSVPKFFEKKSPQANTACDELELVDGFEPPTC